MELSWTLISLSTQRVVNICSVIFRHQLWQSWDAQSSDYRCFTPKWTNADTGRKASDALTRSQAERCVRMEIVSQAVSETDDSDLMNKPENTHTHIHRDICVHNHTHMRTNTYTHTHTHTQRHMCTQSYTHTHMRTNTYTHTHTCTLFRTLWQPRKAWAWRVCVCRPSRLEFSYGVTVFSKQRMEWRMN